MTPARLRWTEIFLSAVVAWHWSWLLDTPLPSDCLADFASSSFSLVYIYLKQMNLKATTKSERSTSPP